VALVTELMRHGMDVKQVNGARQTALHAAVVAHTGAMSTDMVEFLLAQGVDRNALDSANARRCPMPAICADGCRCAS